MSIQQLLFETGFLFEEPDGVFGRNTEAAVKWFQENWNLPVTGVVTEEDRMAMYDCWHSLFNPDGTLIEGEPLPDDQLEPQPLSPDIEGDLPTGGSEGDYPVYCIRYMETDGDEHIEYCGRHAAIAESADLGKSDGHSAGNAHLPAVGGCDQRAIRRMDGRVGRRNEGIDRVLQGHFLRLDQPAARDIDDAGRCRRRVSP